MKEIQIRTLDDKEYELINKMKIIGLPKRVATMFLFLAKNESKSYTSKEIEIATGLRQPDVCIGRKLFNDFLEVTKIRNPNKRGGQVNCFRLNKSPYDIIDYFKKAAFHELIKKEEILKELEENIEEDYQ